MTEKNNLFIDKLIDWKDFELFIADIYKDSDEVIVEHDKTLIGKSNAKRQIDVIVTNKTKLHKYVTIIECKRWKKSVTRQVIDVLFASVEDLNANKGVIFTTKGYEEGAIEYAKSKNIDIFIIRDIRDDEYGTPGKKFSFYLQMFNGRIDNFEIVNPRYVSLTGIKPNFSELSFSMFFTKEQVFAENLQLYSIDNERGKHLTQVFIDLRNHMLATTCKNFNNLLLPQDESTEIGYKSRVRLSFEDYKFRYLKLGDGFVNLETIYFDFYRCITQTKMDFDRTESKDFALVVENYITKQRNYISKSKDEENLILSKPIKNEIEYEQKELMQNNSIIKATTEHYVAFEFKMSTKIIETEKEILIQLQN